MRTAGCAFGLAITAARTAGRAAGAHALAAPARALDRISV